MQTLWPSRKQLVRSGSWSGFTGWVPLWR